MILATADCIVTGDKALLVLRRSKAIEIVCPAKFTKSEASRRD